MLGHFLLSYQKDKAGLNPVHRFSFFTFVTDFPVLETTSSRPVPFPYFPGAVMLYSPRKWLLWTGILAAYGTTQDVWVDGTLHWREIYSAAALALCAPEQAHSQPLPDGSFTTSAFPGFAATDANSETSERSY